MHVLITGANGYSGALLTEFLLSHGHQVTAIAGSHRGRLPEALDENKLFRIIVGDLASDLVLPEKVDAIAHLAARLPLPEVTNNDLVRDNVVATQKMVLYANCIGVQKFIFFSSISVYGQINTPIVNESTSICDPDVYGLTKRIGEILLKNKKNSFCSLILRLPGIIGPSSSPARNWLSRILISAREGREICVFNPEVPFNNVVHISDLNCFILRLLEQEWEGVDVVTLSASGQITILNAVRLIVDAFGGRSIIKCATSPKHNFTISHVRARERYGYESMEISEMVRRFVSEN